MKTKAYFLKIIWTPTLALVLVFPLISVSNEKLDLDSLEFVLETIISINENSDLEIIASGTASSFFLTYTLRTWTRARTRTLQISISNLSTLELQLESRLNENLGVDSSADVVYFRVPEPENLQQFEESIDTLQKALRCSTSCWQPTIFIQWPASSTRARERNNFPANRFPLDSNVFVFVVNDTTGKPHPISVYEMYSLKNVSFVQEIDKDLLGMGAAYLRTQHALRRNNFYGIPIVATAVDDDENRFMVSYESVNGKVRFKSGSSVQLLNDLRDSLNFSVETLVAENYIQEPGSGIAHKTGSSDIGQLLEKGPADVSIPLSYIVPYRVQYLTPLHPLCLDRILLFFQQPPAFNVRDIFSQPFSGELWIALLGAWCLSVGVTFAVEAVHRRYLSDSPSDALEESTAGLCILWAVSTLCQRSWFTHPTTTTARIVCMCGLITGLVPFIAYSASIISTLSSTNVEPVKSSGDLARFEYTILANPLIHYGRFLANNETSIEQVTKNLEKNFVNNVDCVQKVMQRPGFAYVSTADSFTPIAHGLGYADSQFCERVSSVPLNSVILANAFFVKKGSPLKEVFNYRILYTLERGLNSRYIRNLYAETTTRCDQKSKALEEELGLEDLFTAFVIVLVSYSVCLVLLCVECLMMKAAKH